MRKVFVVLAAVLMAVAVMAENKMAFRVGGPESRYNQIRVVNRTSQSDFQCRVVFLNEDNSVKELYGLYHLKGFEDVDSNSLLVRRGTLMGVQLMSDFPVDVVFNVEYKDYPFYDVIIIYIDEQSAAYDDTF